MGESAYQSGTEKSSLADVYRRQVPLTSLPEHGSADIRHHALHLLVLLRLPQLYHVLHTHMAMSATSSSSTTAAALATTTASSRFKPMTTGASSSTPAHISYLFIAISSTPAHIIFFFFCSCVGFYGYFEHQFFIVAFSRHQQLDYHSHFAFYIDIDYERIMVTDFSSSSLRQQRRGQQRLQQYQRLLQQYHGRMLQFPSNLKKSAI